MTPHRAGVRFVPGGPRTALVLVAVAAVVLLHVLRERGRVVPLERVTHVGGLRYVAELPSRVPRGDHIDEHGTWIRCSQAVLLEDGLPVGMAHTLHKEIEEQGGGRYSHWDSALNFSTLDGSDPRANGRLYALRVPSLHPGGWVRLVDAALAAALLRLCLAGGWVRRAWRALRGLSLRRMLARSGLLVAATLLALVAAELLVRAAVARPVVAARAGSPDANIVPVLGEVLQPGTLFIYDGQPGSVSEFHTEARVNAFGMLDVEHAMQKAEGCFRIVVLGDSFVQADQVAMPDKWPRVLERLLAARTGRPVEVVALARDGAGVANEYGYWRGLGRFLQPDLVLELMTPTNDFSDDALQLQSINRNFDPEHPPRYWFRGPAEDFADVPPDVNSRSYRSVEPSTRLQSAYGWLHRRSALVGVIGARLQRRPECARLLVRGGATLARSAQELALLDTPIGYWNWSYADPAGWPAWQCEGYAVTKHALAQLKREVEGEAGARFLVCLGTSKAVLKHSVPQKLNGFELDYDRPDRLALEVLEALGIETLVLNATFLARDGDPTRAHWNNDGHWNETGHAWVAEDITAWLARLGLLP